MVILLLMTPGCAGSSRGRASGDESEPRPRLRSVTYEGDVRHSPALKIAHRELGTQMRPEERHPAPCALPPPPFSCPGVGLPLSLHRDVLLCVVFLTFIFSTWTKPLL